jgi:hypothetical protein
MDVLAGRIRRKKRPTGKQAEHIVVNYPLPPRQRRLILDAGQHPAGEEYTYGCCPDCLGHISLD